MRITTTSGNGQVKKFDLELRLIKGAESFPPHVYIVEEMADRGWNVHDLAGAMRVPVGIASDVMSGIEPVSSLIARRLGWAFGTSTEIWLNLAVNA